MFLAQASNKLLLYFNVFLFMAHVAQVFREQLIRMAGADLLLTLIYIRYANVFLSKVWRLRTLFPSIFLMLNGSYNVTLAKRRKLRRFHFISPVS